MRCPICREDWGHWLFFIALTDDEEELISNYQTLVNMLLTDQPVDVQVESEQVETEQVETEPASVNNGLFRLPSAPGLYVYAEIISQEDADALSKIDPSSGYIKSHREGEGYTIYYYKKPNGVPPHTLAPPKRVVLTGAPRPRKYHTMPAPIISQEEADALPKFKEGGYELETHKTPGSTLYFYKYRRDTARERELQLGFIELLGRRIDVPRPSLPLKPES